MSTIGITSNDLRQVAGLPSAADQFVTDLNHLAHDLQKGDLVAAEQDLVQFSEGVLNSLDPVPAPTSNTGAATAPPSSPHDVSAADGGVSEPAQSDARAGTDPSSSVQPAQSSAPPPVPPAPATGSPPPSLDLKA